MQFAAELQAFQSWAQTNDPLYAIDFGQLEDEGATHAYLRFPGSDSELTLSVFAVSAGLEMHQFYRESEDADLLQWTTVREIDDIKPSTLGLQLWGMMSTLSDEIEDSAPFEVRKFLNGQRFELASLLGDAWRIVTSCMSLASLHAMKENYFVAMVYLAIAYKHTSEISAEYLPRETLNQIPSDLVHHFRQMRSMARKGIEVRADYVNHVASNTSAPDTSVLGPSFMMALTEYVSELYPECPIKLHVQDELHRIVVRALPKGQIQGKFALQENAMLAYDDHPKGTKTPFGATVTNLSSEWLAYLVAVVACERLIERLEEALEEPSGVSRERVFEIAFGKFESTQATELELALARIEIQLGGTLLDLIEEWLNHKQVPSWALERLSPQLEAFAEMFPDSIYGGAFLERTKQFR